MGITVGRPEARPDVTAHVAGVRRGNDPCDAERQPGHLPGHRATARRSTGIDDRSRNPVLPDMPNLPPA